LPTYWGLVAVAHAVRLYERENQRKLHESNLQTSLIQSRLQALQSQLNPHFLFNTLNSIASLLHENPAKAEQMIQALGDLLRLAIATTDRQQITLREELYFLEQYLFIQRIRFGDRLQVETQVDESVLDERVPALILQPLVENAIKYGVETQMGPSLIRISAQADAGARAWRLEVSNDGTVARVNGKKIEERVGLSNTRFRLEAMFGSRADLELQPHETGGFVARIKISRPTGVEPPVKIGPQPVLP
jgi:two-component system, LytTR family, sensor kinase